jgi:hypothetical protein
MKTAFKFLTGRAVALVATIDQNRSNLLFKKLDALRRCGAPGFERSECERKEHNPERRYLSAQHPA